MPGGVAGVVGDYPTPLCRFGQAYHCTIKRTTMTETDIRTSVHDFIKRNFIFDDKQVLGDDQSLLGSGVVDSTGILELISFLEENFRLKFSDSDLVADNFDTVNRIISFVTRRQEPSQA